MKEGMSVVVFFSVTILLPLQFRLCWRDTWQLPFSSFQSWYTHQKKKVWECNDLPKYFFFLENLFFCSLLRIFFSWWRVRLCWTLVFGRPCSRSRNELMRWVRKGYSNLKEISSSILKIERASSPPHSHDSLVEYLFVLWFFFVCTTILSQFNPGAGILRLHACITLLWTCGGDFLIGKVWEPDLTCHNRFLWFFSGVLFVQTNKLKRITILAYPHIMLAFRCEIYTYN